MIKKLIRSQRHFEEVPTCPHGIPYDQWCDACAAEQEALTGSTDHSGIEDDDEDED